MAVDDTPPFYGTVAAANTYFASLLRRDLWFDASAEDREKALVAATNQIDRLNFKLLPTASDQALQFPRTEEDADVLVTTVPTDIEKATYELAYVFLNDVDPDAEIRNERKLSHTFGGVKTVVNGNYVQEHVHAGIPSSQAWHYLYPFLEPIRSFTMQRVT